MHEMGMDDLEKFYAGKFVDLNAQVTHPIGCFDCHEPNTMRLRISPARPARGLPAAGQRRGQGVAPGDAEPGLRTSAT